MSDINIAENKPAMASNSMLPYNAQKAVDGVLAPLNRWMGFSPSVKPEPMWLMVNLGADYWIGRWVVSHMGAVGWPPDNNMCDYRFKVNGHDVDEVKDNNSSKSDRTLATAVKGNFVQVYVTKGLRCNPKYAAIVELEVYEAPNPPYLSNLTISQGVLSPDFSSKTYNYTASVPNNVSSITVTPTAAAGGAAIKVNGQKAINGQAFGPICLAVGDNTICIDVTSSGMEEKYTINVTREGGQVYLSNLAIKTDMDDIVALNPPFNSITLNYTTSVDNGVSYVTVKPTASGATIKVNGITVPSGSTSPNIGLNTGNNAITIEVTPSGGGVSTNYSIIINKSL